MAPLQLEQYLPPIALHWYALALTETLMVFVALLDIHLSVATLLISSFVNQRCICEDIDFSLEMGAIQNVR